MYSARIVGGLSTVALIGILLQTAFAAETPTTSANCSNLLKLAPTTMARPADKVFINAEVCDAYNFLIDRYDPGPRSSAGLSNPKVEGIIYLNPDFAVRLAKMLKAAPYMRINSAYRTPEGQGSKNPGSNHIYGCAVDLGYSQDSCGSAQCQWVLQNAGNAEFKIQIRMKYAPEWNHIEPIDKDACRAGRAGNPNIPSPAPSGPLSTALRDIFSPPPASVPSPTAAQPLSQTQSPIQAFQPQSVTGAVPVTPVEIAETPNAGTNGVSSIIGGTTGNTSSATSAANRLEELAFSTPQSQSKMATSVPLVITGSPAVVIASNQQPAPNTSPTSLTPSIRPTPQTFVSDDLSWQNTDIAFSSGPVTGWDAIFITIRATLNRMLALLQPFGVRSVVVEHGEEAE